MIKILLADNLLTIMLSPILQLISNFAWYFGLPTSESHALISGLAGAGLATAGPSVLVWLGWKKVLIGLLFSTFLGSLGGFLLMLLIYFLFARAHLRLVRGLFSRLQIRRI